MDVLTWRKSSYSSANGGECVEIGTLSYGVAIRDGKAPEKGHLTASAAAFGAFLAGLKR
ncbi:DUF397 domain-containing protein [Sphaerisporangium sp. NPDC005288]|uniref:DUF397 domain-containing protein n=1 Tax=Sphaerisporangium sp. NPDC005288 TaxID=3155114 RepID=UPI0033A41C6D